MRKFREILGFGGLLALTSRHFTSFFFLKRNASAAAATAPYPKEIKRAGRKGTARRRLFR